MKALKTLLCTAVIAAAQTPPKIPLVAVMPLTAEGVDDASALVVTDALSDQLMRDGRVRVMERTQMEKILKEQGFQQSGVCDGTDCALVMGKLLAIDRMVVGSLGKLGESYTLSVRVVDVASGEVLGSARRMRKGAIDDVIADLLPLVTKDLSFQKNSDRIAAAVVPNPAPAPASTPLATTPSVAGSGSGHAWVWWTAGGVVVAGGAIAAILLDAKSSPSSGPAATTTVSLDARWK
ncbi:MAG TPA: CsgG/HfaB family protein [Fibrobacteria bacterium]|nr:CsgG/HfaB family protein [Fibrobacteria bacterium]